jgi:hypothetical protein
MSAEKTWKKPEGAGSSIEFIRPSQLTEEDNGRVVLEGVFIETLPNHYDDTKVDYKVEKEDGSMAVINGAGNLGYRMKSISPGDLVQITYEGKQEITNGKFKGRAAHSFDVLIGE